MVAMKLSFTITLMAFLVILLNVNSVTAGDISQCISEGSSCKKGAYGTSCCGGTECIDDTCKTFTSSGSVIL
jgi:hypothetical protein